MFNLALFSLLNFGYYEELPVVKMDNPSTVVIVRRTTPLRRRVYVEVPVATIESNTNIVKTTNVQTTVVETNASPKILQIVTERPIFPRVNSLVRNVVTPRRVDSSAVVVDENPNEVKIEKKTTVSSSNNNFTETTETTTTFQSDMIVEQRRGILGRTRYRFFR